MKKILIWSIVIAIAFSLSLIGVGCKEEAAAEEEAPAEEAVAEEVAEEAVVAEEVIVEEAAPEKFKIGVSVNATANLFTQTMFESAEKYLKEAGFDVAMVNANGHAVQQTTDIENLIQQGVDLLVIQNADRDGIRNVVLQAIEKGIPVISEYSGWIPGMTTMFTQNDFVIAGEIYLLMATEMDFEGKMFRIGHTNHPAIRVRLAMQQTVLDEYKDIIEASEITSAYPGTVEISYAGVESALEAHPDVKAIWTTQDLEAMGAAQAVKAAGLEDQIIICGGDGELDVLRMINEGGPVIITAVPDLIGTSQELAEVATKILNGEPVNKLYPINVSIVTKENIGPFLEAAEERASE